MDLMLFHHARHSMVIQGLARRKALAFAQPKWLKVSREGLVVDDTTRLFDMAVTIPGLLERIDDFLFLSEDQDKSSGLVNDFATTLENLYEWLNQWYAGMGNAAYELVDVSDFTTFTRYCNDNTFPMAYQFPSFMVAYMHSLYWLYLVVVQRGLLEYLLANPNIVSMYTTDRLRKDVLTNMLNLCQTFPYFCEPNASSIGRFATFMPLYVAMEYFEVRQMHAQLQWCVKLTNSIYCDGITPPWMPKWQKASKRDMQTE
ncbi:hypothetical protein MBLNU459_g1736t2 [Dothideomycetes sp. NU459]